jgi:hypothetical protein
LFLLLLRLLLLSSSSSEIIMSASWNLDIDFPPPYGEFLSLLSVFSLDFLRLECLPRSEEDTASERYFSSLYLYSCLPLGVAGVAVAVGMWRLQNLAKDFSIVNSYSFQAIFGTSFSQAVANSFGTTENAITERSSRHRTNTLIKNDVNPGLTTTSTTNRQRVQQQQRPAAVVVMAGKQWW